MLELTRRGSFLVALPQREVDGPRELWIDGEKWFRFMDKIYCPAPVHQLTPRLVAELCELRLELLSAIRDERVYTAAVAELTTAVQSSLARPVPVVLDFGTGSAENLHRLRRILPWAVVVGCDISFRSLHFAGPGSGVFQVAEDGSLPLKSGSVDLVHACFVLHFGVPAAVFAELYRVSRDDGHLCATVYGPGGRRSLALLGDAGWKVVDDTAVRDAAGHRIVRLAK